MQNIPKRKETVFITGIIFLAILLRSDLIVDRSLLPRFLALTLVILSTFLLFFRKKTILEQNFWTFALLGFYLWNVVSCFWATSVTEALMQSQLIFIGIAIFILISILIREDVNFENIFIRALILVLLFSFVLAFFKISSLKYYDPYKILSISFNNNLYSGFLLLSLPFLFAGYALFKGTWKYISVFTGILTFFFLIIVQTRAAYMGLALALIIIAFLLLLKYRSVFSKKNILTVVIALLLLFLAVFRFYSTLDETRSNAFKSKIAVWNYFMPQRDLGKSVSKEPEPLALKSKPVIPAIDIPVEYYENVNTRLIFWGKSLGLIKNHPLIGVGAGNWRILVPSVSEPPNPEHTIRNFTYSQPHNEWIGILSELGIIGFILAVIVFFAPVLIIFFRIIFNRSHPPVAVIFYTGFLVGFYLYASFDFPFQRVEHLLLVYSIFAFLFSKMALSLQKSPSAVNIFGNKFFSISFVCLLIFSIIISLARLKGEYNTLSIFKNEKNNDKIVIHYCHKARNLFYSITPNTLPVDWFEGVAHYRLGDKDSALVCFESALRSTPYEVRVINDYGAALFASGKSDLAIRELKDCVAIDPYFDDAKFNLSAIYYSKLQIDSALIYINQCRDSQKKKDYLSEIEASRKDAIH